MSDPRWTVDDEGLVRWRDLHAVAALNEDSDDCFEAYDALVAVVRDADLLPAVTAERDTLHAVVSRIAAYLEDGRADFHSIGFFIGGMEDDIRAALAVSSPGTQTDEDRIIDRYTEAGADWSAIAAARATEGDTP